MQHTSGRARVLVVEDNQDLGRLMADHLCAQGHEAEHVGEAAGALERVTAGGVDLVVLDLMLPRLSGDGLLSRLRGREATRDLPVIVVSAKDAECWAWARTQPPRRLDSGGAAGAVASVTAGLASVAFCRLPLPSVVHRSRLCFTGVPPVTARRGRHRGPARDAPRRSPATTCRPAGRARRQAPQAGRPRPGSPRSSGTLPAGPAAGAGVQICTVI